MSWKWQRQDIDGAAKGLHLHCKQAATNTGPLTRNNLSLSNFTRVEQSRERVQRTSEVELYFVSRHFNGGKLPGTRGCISHANKQHLNVNTAFYEN